MNPSVLMIGYAFFQTLVWLSVSYMGGLLSITTMFLFRNLVGATMSSIHQGSILPSLSTWKRWKMHVVRSSATLIGGICIFYSVTIIPVADAIAITFLAPVFGSLLAAIILGDSLSRTTVVKIVLGILGVYCITEFSNQGEIWGYLASLLGAFMTGLAYVSVKSLSYTETTTDILKTSYFLMLPIAVLIALPEYQHPTASELFWLLAIGIFFYTSQLLMAKALSLAPASRIMPLDFTRVIFSSVLGFFFLDQMVSLNTLAGTVLIVGSSMIKNE